MSPTPTTCHPALLQLSLDERLSDAQEEALGQHLSHCERCRQELERLAGRREDWSRIGSALQFEASRSSGGAHSSARPAHDDETVDEAVDFAVDFLEPSPVPEALGRLGDVEIVEVIGRGGMGLVLKGHQPELKRLVAVKVLAPQLAVSGAARKRFAREAQAAAAILHPNVMPILSVHSTGKLPYLVMPYLAGESLEQRLRRTGPLDLGDLLRIGVQAAQGLAAAHAQGLIHRDVKPANILLERGIERAMLTDFGLARAIDDASITRTGLIAGTPQYMSPEQARGEPLDARSDLFSLGAVLYCMATGRPPFRAESTYGILRRIVEDQPRAVREVNPQIPEWLAAIIGKLLAKRPADRFASAEEVATLLERCLAHVQQPLSIPLPKECEPERHPSTGRSLRRRRTLQLAGAVALMAGVAVIGVALSQFPRLRTSETARLASSGEATAAANKESAWNTSSAEVDDLFRDLSAFAQRAERMWDQPPTPAPAATAASADQPAAEPEDGRADFSYRKLAVMKGWILAWDRRNRHEHGDGERRPMLRVFPDGRVLAVQDYWHPLMEGRLTPDELREVQADFVVGGTERKAEALQIDVAAARMTPETHQELQAELRNLELEHKLGDPLPMSLWDQQADRVTVVHEGKLYDRLWISEPWPSRPLSAERHADAPGPRNNVAALTREDRAKLGELMSLAAIGSSAEKQRLVAFANAALQKRHPNTPIRLTANNLGAVGRNRDGSLYLYFGFSRDAQQQSFPSGELRIHMPPGAEPYVDKARYWIDAQTEDAWGRREAPAKEQPGAGEQAAPAQATAAPTDEAGWDPHGNSQRLAALKGWVLAWDETFGKTDVERRPILRVFPDGRVLSVLGLGQPLCEATIGRNEVAELVEYFASRGTSRRTGAIKYLDSMGEGLTADEHAALIASLRAIEFDHHLGDPLPEGLWDQSADRVTVIQDGKVFDLLSITPPHWDRPDPQGLRNIAELTGESRTRLRAFMTLATLGGREKRDQLIELANHELEQRIHGSPFRLTAEHLRTAGHDSDGTLAVQFAFSRDPQRYSFPSGELWIRVAPGQTPHVDRARVRTDEQTELRWGRRAEKPSP